MKESRKYLHFFQQNFLLIVVPALSLAVGSYLYTTSLPTIYEQTELWQLPYTTDNIHTQVALTDQAIGVLRAETLHQQLGLSENTEVVVFKPSPLSISTTTKGTNPEMLAKDLETLKQYGQQQYQATQVGQRITTQTFSNHWLYVAGGLGIGVILGILLSLIKTYFSEY